MKPAEPLTTILLMVFDSCAYDAVIFGPNA